MDPYQNQRHSGNHPNNRRNQNTPGTPRQHGTGETGEENCPPGRDATDPANTQSTDRTPQFAGAYTVIPPNEARRSHNRMIAQKGEEAYQRYKEANRPSAVHTNPEQLGGSHVSMAEARQKQLQQTEKHLKWEKKLKKDEMDRRKRQEEDEKNQRMKDEQRQKAERLEQKRREDDRRRQEQHRLDHLRSNEHFLQQFERPVPGSRASCTATHTPSESSAVENKQKTSVEDVHLQHQRVNSAFLDRLEGRGRAEQEEEMEEEEEDFTLRTSDTSGHQHLATSGHQQQATSGTWNSSSDPNTQCHFTDRRVGAGPQPDSDWALVSLMGSFPDIPQAFLEDILTQCQGDYEQASTLLVSTLLN